MGLFSLFAGGAKIASVFARLVAAAHTVAPIAVKLKEDYELAAPVVDSVLSLVTKFAAKSDNKSVADGVEKARAIVGQLHAVVDGAPGAIDMLTAHLAEYAPPDTAKGDLG